MRKIVVGVDSSPAAERALERAVFEAESTGRPLDVLHAWTTPVWIGGVPGLGYNILATAETSREYAGQLLGEVVQKGLSSRRDTPSVPVEEHVAEGDPGRVLVREGAEAALIVVGGRSHGPVASTFFGSTTGYVMHHTSTPVMIVPTTGAPVGPFHRVVVGVDGSPSSRSAMRWAHDAARRHGCPLVAVHAWVLSTLPGRAPVQHLPAAEVFEADAREWMAQEVAEVLPAPGEVEVQVQVSHSSPSVALIERAGVDDLLVVGSRGHGGFATLLLGSVATQCTQHASSVVTVVRAGNERLDD